MLQHINLYKLLPKKRESFLNKRFLIKVYGGFFILLVLLYVISLRQIYHVNAELDKVTSELSDDQKKVNRLIQQYPVTDIETLKKNIIDLQQQVLDQVKISDLVSPYANYSAYLFGLGEAIVPGVWLTEISFHREDPKVRLKGYALQASLLEHFFSQLISLPVFSELTFKLDEIKQNNFPTAFYITAKQADIV